MSRCSGCHRDLERHSSLLDLAEDRLHVDRCWLSLGARSSYRGSCIEGFADHRWEPLAGCCLADDGTCCCNGVESILSQLASSQLGQQLLLHRSRCSRMPLAGLHGRCSEAHGFHFFAVCHGFNHRAHCQAAWVATVVCRQVQAHTSLPASDFCFACNFHHVAQVAFSWLHRELLVAIGSTSLHSLSVAIGAAIAGWRHTVHSKHILAALLNHFALKPSFLMPLGASFD